MKMMIKSRCVYFNYNTETAKIYVYCDHIIVYVMYVCILLLPCILVDIVYDS